MPGVRLEWDSKTAEIPRRRMPLQIVETINASRADRDGWRNKLIWGDNLHVLASLAEELAGQVDLIYIDPPFDTRQDYKVRIGVGDGGGPAGQDLANFSFVLEEKAYRDSWGKDIGSYLDMLYPRLVLLRELLSDRGSLFLHLAPHASHLARVLLDEIFGAGNFRAEIIWKRTAAHSDHGQGARRFGPVHDCILYFTKSDSYIWNKLTVPHSEQYVESKYRHVEKSTGRRYRLDNLTGPGGAAKGNPYYEVMGVSRYWRYSASRMEQLIAEGRVVQTRAGGVPQFKRYLDESEGISLQDVWTDIDAINSQATQRLGYDTQKPEALLERIIRSSSDEGSIVLDCFAGSGTTAVVAERLKRRWVAVDIGRFAIHTARKRLLDMQQREPFVVANLGCSERRAWQHASTGPQAQAYLDFVVTRYGASPTAEFQQLHGSKGRRAVHVGTVDAAVDLVEIKEALEEAAAVGIPALDVLGWEFEMGLPEMAQDEARARGIDLQLRRIPREVMDPQVADSGEVVFHQLAHLEVATTVRNRKLTVTLTGFVLPNPDLVPASVRSKISGWSDYVDYWAVDFSYGAGGHGDIFHNQWQSYRTRASRTLARNTTYDYDQPGSYTVLVKVVDIFGVDTTTAVKVSVK